MEIVLLAVLGTAVWAFFDAPNHGLSRWWAVGVLMLWIVFFPWYLATRSPAACRRRAEAHRLWQQQHGGV